MALGRIFYSLAFVLAGLGPLAAEQVTHMNLDNGLEIVVIKDHRAPVITHMLWYRTGSADEPEGASGLAHFLEHLMFKATQTRGSGEFSEIVAANGGQSNAFTSYDYTAYFQRVSRDQLPLMMQLEADRMRGLRLSEEDIATERQVIIEERRQRTDTNPSALMGERMNALQYDNHPYAVPIIGWMHEMETLGMQQVTELYDQSYAPNNAILIVAGDADPQDVHRLAQTYYGPIPPNPDLPERMRSAEPEQIVEKRMILRDARVAQPYVRRTYLAPERDAGAQQEAAALTLLAEILGGGTTSYLAEKLQFDDPVMVYTGAYYNGVSLDDTSFGLIVVPNRDTRLHVAEQALDQALAAFMDTPIDPEQLARIKTRLKAAEIYARDSSGGLANRYGRALTSGLSVEDVQAWPAVLENTSAEDIMTVARRVLRPERSVTGYIMAPPDTSQEETQ